MITVRYSEQGKERHFSCIGHADYSVGNDVVCAAVSALCGALAVTLLKNEESFDSLTVAEADGETVILCNGQAEGYFSLVLNGLESIAASYPFNVRVLREEKPTEEGGC